MKTTVVHVRDGCDVRIGRPSKWGNPFVIGRDGNRKDVVAKYRAWVVTQPHLMSALHELRGKRIGCYCAPIECHGDVLAELADTLGKHAVVVKDGFSVPLIGINPGAMLERCDLCGNDVPLRVAVVNGTQILCAKCSS